MAETLTFSMPCSHLWREMRNLNAAYCAYCGKWRSYVMTIHDAEPGDIYVDARGKLWRIISTCREPTVTAEEVEGQVEPFKLEPANDQAQAAYYAYQVPQIIKARQGGGISGLMWQGWKRIWRKEPST